MPAVHAAGNSLSSSEVERAMKVAAAGLALLLAAAKAGATDASPVPAKADTCIVCHGANGISQIAETPSLAGQPEGFLQWQLVFFRSGTRKSPLMQAMAATLSDDDIRRLSAYFSRLEPPPRDADGAVDAAVYEAGRQLSQRHRCATCHKDDYSGAQATARTANQREDYLLKALREFKAGARTGGGVAAMADVVYPLDDAELRALAHFMAHLR